MVLLLDTNICIYLIRERPRSILERFDEHAVGDIGISAITLAELEYGVGKSSKPGKNKQALDQFIAPLIVADFDRSTTGVYGKLRTTLEKRGEVRPI